MKYLIIVIGLIANTAAAQSVVRLNQSECILISNTYVCAGPYREQSPIVTVLPRPENLEAVKAMGVCALSTGKSPNTWDLYRLGGTVSNPTRLRIKSFPHFEQSACQAEAERIR